MGNWPEEHVRQVIRAVVFRDGTIPSYGNGDSSTDMLPPPSRCDSSGQSDTTLSQHHLSSPPFEKKPRLDAGINNGSKPDMFTNGGLFPRENSRSVSPPSNMNRHQRTESFSPHNNVPGNSVMNHLEGISLATQLQQMYRQQLAAASQILVANKMAANAAMANCEGGNDLTSAALTAAAMSNILALDPAFKALMNENDDREEKFADADDSNNEYNDTDSTYGDDKATENLEDTFKNKTNGGVSPPRIQLGKSSNNNKPLRLQEKRDSDSNNATENEKNCKTNKEGLVNQDLLSSMKDPLDNETTEPSLALSFGSNVGNIRMSDNGSSHNEDATNLNDMNTDASVKHFLKKGKVNGQESFSTEDFVETNNDCVLKETSSLPAKLNNSDASKAELNTSLETNEMSPIPGTSGKSDSWRHFLPADDEDNEEEGNIESKDNKKSDVSNNQYGEIQFESNASANFQEVQ